MARPANAPPPENEKRPADVGTTAERKGENQSNVISTAIAARIKRVDARAPLSRIVEAVFADGRWDDRQHPLCFLVGTILVNTVNNRWTNVSNGHSGCGSTSLVAEAYGLDLEAAAASVEALLRTLADEDGDTDWPSFIKEAA